MMLCNVQFFFMVIALVYFKVFVCLVKDLFSAFQFLTVCTLIESCSSECCSSERTVKLNNLIKCGGVFSFLNYTLALLK